MPSDVQGETEAFDFEGFNLVKELPSFVLVFCRHTFDKCRHNFIYYSVAGLLLVPSGVAAQSAVHWSNNHTCQRDISMVLTLRSQS